MTLSYRDLPATAFAPGSFSFPELMDDWQWFAMSIGPQGDLFIIRFRKGIGWSIHGEFGQEVDLRPPDGNPFWPAEVQRCSDGRWLVVEARTEDLEPNAFVFEPDGSFNHAFYAGDGIWRVLIDRLDRIWIGYHKGLFSAVGLPPEHKARQFGPNGLVRIDDRGEVEFGFNDGAGDREITSVHAMTIDDDDRIWLCPSDKFFVASVSDETIEFTFDQAPVGGAQAMSVGLGHAAFFGACIVTVVELATQRLRLIQLRDDDGTPLSPQRVATRGENAVGMIDDRFYRLDLDVLLDALGPWTNDNSSSVASAVQYREEESSYAQTTTIDFATGRIRTNLGKPRRPENQPRNDCGQL